MFHPFKKSNSNLTRTTFTVVIIFAIKSADHAHVRQIAKHGIKVQLIKV